MDIRNIVAFSFHRYWLSQRLRLEVAGCKRQAHNSHSSKNNEHDVLHGVTSFSDMTVESILLSFSAILTAHPLSYVRPAVEELDTVFFTGVQKSNDLDIHERHSVEVQRNPRPSAFQLRLQFLQVLRLQPTA
jgi:hypothetical protein